ncbi:MAG TPA: hypothetical protein VHZ03_30090, partial [Trebonia sp.]|nr:hypothetical protein [Trebonia sp.]
MGLGGAQWRADVGYDCDGAGEGRRPEQAPVGIAARELERGQLLFEGDEVGGIAGATVRDHGTNVGRPWVALLALPSLALLVLAGASADLGGTARLL